MSDATTDRLPAAGFLIKPTTPSALSPLRCGRRAEVMKMVRAIITVVILGAGISSANAQFREVPRVDAGRNVNPAPMTKAPQVAAKREVKPGRVNMTANVPGCVLPTDLDKYLNLIHAGRQDAADKYACTVLEEGTQAVAVDRIGMKYMQILVDHDGKSSTLWTYYKYALDDRAFIFFKECGEGIADPACRARVAAELD